MELSGKFLTKSKVPYQGAKIWTGRVRRHGGWGIQGGGVLKRSKVKPFSKSKTHAEENQKK